ncbi:hypothetical protein BC628DRAFT_243194 [Trametes gibbosa]|nr:hypothetical protein BC628DRAFT_243194 [Trametes gibbosa]
MGARARYPKRLLSILFVACAPGVWPPRNVRDDWSAQRPSRPTRCEDEDALQETWNGVAEKFTIASARSLLTTPRLLKLQGVRIPGRRVAVDSWRAPGAGRLRTFTDEPKREFSGESGGSLSPRRQISLLILHLAVTGSPSTTLLPDGGGGHGVMQAVGGVDWSCKSSPHTVHNYL